MPAEAFIVLHVHTAQVQTEQAAPASKKALSQESGETPLCMPEIRRGERAQTCPRRAALKSGQLLGGTLPGARRPLPPSTPRSAQTRSAWAREEVCVSPSLQMWLTLTSNIKILQAGRLVGQGTPPMTTAGPQATADIHNPHPVPQMLPFPSPQPVRQPSRPGCWLPEGEAPGWLPALVSLWSPQLPLPPLSGLKTPKTSQ